MTRLMYCSSPETKVDIRLFSVESHLQDSIPCGLETSREKSHFQVGIDYPSLF